MWRRGQLSNRILASVLAILVATTVVGFVLDTLSRRAISSIEYQRRALAIGPDVRGHALDPRGAVPP